MLRFMPRPDVLWTTPAILGRPKRAFKSNQSRQASIQSNMSDLSNIRAFSNHMTGGCVVAGRFNFQT